MPCYQKNKHKKNKSKKHHNTSDDEDEDEGGCYESTFYEYVENYPVYQNDRIGGLSEGISLMITGKILKNCERFSVNLMLGNDSHDVALHINPRLPQNYIVRNSKVHDVWGNEEVSSCLPFCLFRGKVFRIQILVTKQCYMISINGNHFAKYVHRVPYQNVSTLDVKGDVDDISMELSRVTYYPNRLPESAPKDVRVVTEPSPSVNDDSGMDEGDYDDSDGASIIPYEFKQIPKQIETTAERVGLELPYYGKLPPKSLVVGHCLRVEGRVKLLPHSFYINLQHGAHIWPHPTIAFHFNPRFSKQSGTMGKHVVVRNAWFNDDWAQEQRSEMDTNLRPGKTFRLAIVCAAHEYEVYVNRKLITTFTYCVEPQVVDTVYIQGDIKLWDVWLDKSSSLKSKRRKHKKHHHSKNKTN